MIKNLPATILLLFALCLSGQQAHSQAAQVNRSKDKIILEGKVYYIHVVREGETLYRISKAYNVTEKVIASENPDVFGGLQAGMYLKIPAEPVVDESVEIEETDDYIYHVIKEGETLFFLSRKYGIDLVEIEKANPEVTVSEIQVNQVIKIPKRKEPGKQADEFPSDSFVFHYVQPGETLYSLSLKYDVSIEEIKEINPELRWGELKSDEYIKIPLRQEMASTDSISMELDSLETGIREGTDTDTLTAFEYKIEEDSAGVPFWSTLKRRRYRPEPIEGAINVAMLLPLYLHWDEVEEDSTEFAEDLLVPEEEEEENMVNPRIVLYLEFYEGALLALDSLRKLGHRVTLYTYDTERDRTRTREILQKPEMRDMDLIIGPISFWNIELVSDFARRHEIPMVSPFSSNKSIVNYNPWVFQPTPTYEVEFKAWAEYLSDQYDKTMILVHSGDSNKYQRIRYLKNELFRNISEKADFEDLVFKEVIMNDSIEVDMAHVLNMEQPNLVIVPSDNEAYVSNVVSPLFYQLREYDIQVSGMSQWSRFRNIDLIYFHDLNICYFTSFHMDYDKPEMEEFIDRFYSVYRTQPYRLSPRGYNLSVYGFDLVHTFVNAVAQYGENLIYFGEQIESDPILGPYRFRRISDYGGHVNTYISMVKFYPDLSIKQIELDTRPTQDFRYYRPYFKRRRD